MYCCHLCSHRKRHNLLANNFCANGAGRTLMYFNIFLNCSLSSSSSDHLSPTLFSRNSWSTIMPAWYSMSSLPNNALVGGSPINVIALWDIAYRLRPLDLPDAVLAGGSNPL